VRLDTALWEKLNAYLARGGKLLLTGESGLKKDADEFAFDTGADFAGENGFRPDYLVPDFETVNGRTEYVMYSRGMKLENITGEVFAHRQNSYFNRAWNHFCSHKHTPNDVSANIEPAAVLKGNIAYIAWDIFEDYATAGELIAKETVIYAIKRLMNGCETVKTNLPDKGVVTLTKQGSRQIVHLLYTATTLRGKNVEVIEDAVPLHNIAVSVACDKQPESVYLAPEKTPINFEWDGKHVSFTVPEITLHQMIAIE